MGKYVKAYYDWVEQTAALTDAEKGRLFIAILEYARSGSEPQLDGGERILFPAFRCMVDRDSEKSAILAENGSKGGKQTQANSSKPKQTKANSSEVKPTNNIRHNTKYKRQKTEDIRLLIPPAIEDVRAYCLERGNGVSPERFMDYYSSNGWMVGRNKMKDWQAAVRSWERKDGQKQTGTKSFADLWREMPDE